MTFIPPDPNETDEYPHFVDVSAEFYSSGMKLKKDLILRRTDNPHELLLAVCSKCKERRDAQRIELHLAGWQVAVETRPPDHDWFILCPECSKQEYVWEDLY